MTTARNTQPAPADVESRLQMLEMLVSELLRSHSQETMYAVGQRLTERVKAAGLPPHVWFAWEGYLMQRAGLMEGDFPPPEGTELALHQLKL